MSEYVPTIGLEIHAQLKTTTKMFCSSKNDADETKPNVNICPVCLAHPGTLPVINREAVRHVLRVGVALSGTLADYTEFDRKNYFYPDLPKGYQLSQYKYPLISGGELQGVAVTRVHLEEDTASSIHEEGIGTTIDYNRAGIPLMELVTEPVITSAKEAGDFARELQLLLRYLGASDANMEKGEMRVEANVSVGRAGTRGTKVEIKNLNSFRAMERAVEYEIKRQEALLSRGEAVVQETRGWDEGKQATFSQRVKEGSADYRYFPDPDLPSLKLSEVPEFASSMLAETMPELPWRRRERYLGLGVRAEDADSFVREPSLGGFFEEVITGIEGDPRRVVLASNLIANDLVAIISSSAPPSPPTSLKLRRSKKPMEGHGKASKGRRDTGKRDTEKNTEISISAHNFRKIIDMRASEKLSSAGAKELLQLSISTGRDPDELVNEHNLLQMSSEGDFEPVVEAVLVKNPSVVADYKAGKLPALEYLVGQAMKATRGTANPQIIREMISSRLLSPEK